MKANGVVVGMRRRSLAEVERLVSECERSGLGREEFCAASRLSAHILDAWRRRIGGSRAEMVPVEIVKGRAAGMGSMRARSRDDLFAIDREAREQTPSFDDRHALRKMRAPGLLSELTALLQEMMV